MHFSWEKLFDSKSDQSKRKSNLFSEQISLCFNKKYRFVVLLEKLLFFFTIMIFVSASAAIGTTLGC